MRGGERTTEEGMLRIVDVDGTYDSKMEPKLPAEVLKTAYRHLVLVRTLDTRMLSLQRQGRIGFYVPSTGEEACQIGARWRSRSATGSSLPTASPGPPSGGGSLSRR